MSKTTKEVKAAMRAILADCDVGIAIAALGWATGVLFRGVDRTAPHLSDHVRDDFNRHMTDTAKTVN